MKRRAEQYESEVRKLRGRVEELKHDLANAEDEVGKFKWKNVRAIALTEKFTLFIG